MSAAGLSKVLLSFFGLYHIITEEDKIGRETLYSPPAAPGSENRSTRDYLTDGIFLFYRLVNRVNRVPYYQRLFQQNDGVRQWYKVRKRILLCSVSYSLLLGGGRVAMGGRRESGG